LLRRPGMAERPVRAAHALPIVVGHGELVAFQPGDTLDEGVQPLAILGVLARSVVYHCGAVREVGEPVQHARLRGRDRASSGQNLAGCHEGVQVDARLQPALEHLRARSCLKGLPVKDQGVAVGIKRQEVIAGIEAVVSQRNHYRQFRLALAGRQGVPGE